MKNKKITFVFMILLVLTLQNILAIGVTPGRTTLNYDGDLNTDVTFKILNSENKDMNVSLFIQGDLSDYIILNQNYIEFLSSESSKNLGYQINIPYGVLTPGEHLGEIIITEDYDEESNFVAKVSVSTQIYIFVPYPTKYIESDMRIIESDDGNSTEFIIPVINKGQEKINNVSMFIDIYLGNDKIDTINSDSISLDTMERSELNANWDVDADFGNYNAVVIITYDDEKILHSKQFQVGEILLDVSGIIINNFKLGDIVELSIFVENKWPEDLEEVYANMIIYDSDKNVVVDIKSPVSRINAFDEIVLPI